MIRRALAIELRLAGAALAAIAELLAPPAEPEAPDTLDMPSRVAAYDPDLPWPERRPFCVNPPDQDEVPYS